MEQTGTSPRGTILVVDDSPMNRMLLRDILEEDYTIVEAEDGEEAVEALAESYRDIDLVILDIMMPKLDGFGVLDAMNENGWIDRCPVVTISADGSADYVEHAYDLGVTDFITRPFDELVVRHRVRNTIQLNSKQHDLMAMISSQMFRKERTSNLMVSILSHIMESHNGESGLHVMHIGLLTDIILDHLAAKTDKYPISPMERSTITTASALHDIGKITVPPEIINKPGRLTDEEFAIMKTHSAAGAEMLSDLPFSQEADLVKCAYDISRWHHERWDGGGYPDGLAGDEIPISAQVVALADVYDALTSARVYKPPFSHEKALDMIVHGECGQFNPLLLECLEEASEEIREELAGDAMLSLVQREMGGIIGEVQDADFLSQWDKDDMIEDILALSEAYGA